MTDAPVDFARALSELRPVLLQFALRAVRDRATADDLVQEALAAAVRGASGYQVRARLRTWATGILANKIADHFRAKARASALHDEGSDVDLTVADGYRSPESHAARRQALSALSAALGTLPDLERLAVLAVDVEGIEHDDACHHLGVTATHLRVLLHRARHKLRKAIEHAVL